MLCSFPALRGRKSIYSARRKDLGRSSEGAVDYDKLSQAMQRGIRPILHLHGKPSVICRVSAGWTTGLLDPLLSLNWHLFSSD